MPVVAREPVEEAPVPEFPLIWASPHAG